MKSRNRPNLGLILFGVLLAAAVLYSVLTGNQEKRRLSDGMAIVQTIVEQETSALIFPDDAVQDGDISAAEMAAAEHALTQAMASLYPADPDMQELRFERLSRDLEQQAASGRFLRTLDPDWDLEPVLTVEGGLVLFEVKSLYLDVEFVEDNSSEAMTGYRLEEGLSFLFRDTGGRLVLIEQADAAASRVLTLELGDYSAEGDMPWKRPF